MLYGYPLSAVAENWLHEALVHIVQSVHDQVNAGQPVQWPEIIPDAFRDELTPRTGLRDRVFEYAEAIKLLPLASRSRVLTCMFEQNKLATLLDCSTDCDRISDLPEGVRDSIGSLFSFAFSLLTPLGIRDRHYNVIYSHAADPVCPFCGLEPFDAPGALREDLDHYLAKTHYPFAAVNLLNLSPMGGKCNGYKLQEDILRSADGARRPSFNPYEDHSVSISLNESVPFAGENKLPQWQIDFFPPSAECDTWDAIFRVRERMQRDVLNKSFRRWLGDFAVWFKRRKGIGNLSDAFLIHALNEHAEDMAIQGLKVREFLRAHVFSMIHHHCCLGNQRLIALVRSLITTAIPH